MVEGVVVVEVVFEEAEVEVAVVEEEAVVEEASEEEEVAVVDVDSEVGDDLTLMVHCDDHIICSLSQLKGYDLCQILACWTHMNIVSICRVDILILF